MARHQARTVRLAGAWLLLAVMLLAALTVRASDGSSAPGDASRALARLLEQEWQWRLREFPEFATSVGDHRYDDRVADLSAAAVAGRRDHHARLLASLQSLDRGALDGEDRISLDTVLEEAEVAVAEDKLLSAHAPPDAPFSADDLPLAVSQIDGPQFNLLDLHRLASFLRVEDWRGYLRRLRAVPRQLAQLQARMEAARVAGWLPPRKAVARLPGQFDGVLEADPARNGMLVPFARLPDSVDPQVASALRTEAADMLRDELLPALRAFRDWLAGTWLPACPDTAGAAPLPAGQAWYALQLRRQNTTAMSPAEIHTLGLQEVARIRRELAQVLQESGYPGSLDAWRGHLLGAAEYRFRDGQEELEAFRTLAKRIDPQLPELFVALPRLPYGVRAMHEEEGDNAPHYTPGASDGSRAGWFEANTHNLAGTPRWAIESLLLHESVPGHHLQIARAQEQRGLPELRRNLGIAAFDEGWALYCESLGYRLGLYRTPETRFGRLADEALRAARLVADTGLHAMGWTRQQAIDYLIESGQQERGYAEAEADRYLVWPGQATAYKLGELRIRALRDEAQAALGPRFDLRGFHNAVIDHGAMPLEELSRVVREWIRAQGSITVGAATPAAVQGAGTAGAALDRLLDDEFAWHLAQFPERATTLGEHDRDAQVADLSARAVAARRQHHREFLAALEALDRQQLQGEQRISWDIFHERASQDVALDRLLMSTATDPLAPWSADDPPLALDQMSGIQFGWPQLVRSTRFETEQDYRHFLSRVAAMPAQLGQLRARLEAARQAGWMPPAVAVARLSGQFGPLLAQDPADHALYAPFRTIASGLSPGIQEDLRARARDELREHFVPAMRAFRDWLVADWLPHARATTAASALPRGAEYYGLMLQRQGSTRLGADEIHQIGLDEVARIDGELRKVQAEAGFPGSATEFRDWLRSDPRFRYETADAELAALRAMAKRVDAQLPELFATLPRLPYGVRPMSVEEGNNAPHYIPGALDGSRAGWFEANLNNLAAWPSWTLDALFLHEAVPGHHLQIARAQELDGLPRLRRIYANSAYVEGWGLYAEGFGQRLGLYADPYARYGRLTLEAHRACRLVVDTGLHAQGWTRQQAIDYLIAHASLERGFAEAEVDRYLVWPGQAVAYKLGELDILANRRKAQQALGERFDVRRFHNALLDHGVLPLAVLDRVIDDWITQQQGMR